MSKRIHIKSGEKIALDLTDAERRHILEDLTFLEPELEAIFQKTPADQAIKMALDDLDQLAGCVAAEANHTKNRKLGKSLDRIFGKIDELLDTYTDEEPPETLSVKDAKQSKLIADSVAELAGWVAKAMLVAEQLQIEAKTLDEFPASDDVRAVLTMLPAVTKQLKRKLAKPNAGITIVEAVSLVKTVADSLPDAAPQQQLALLLIAKNMLNSLQDRIAAFGKEIGAEEPRDSKPTATAYQFKITLLGIQPPIWRRIQVKNCTLDKLHEHIQIAMGWTNSHLHQFKINKTLYGDPDLIEENFDEMGFKDSTRTKLSAIVPKSGKRFSFEYEYDFGDSWEHEVLFEGCPKAKKGAKYPLCLEGERACPPEDVGGIGGYQEFLEAIADPKHERHDEFMEWCGALDPDKFSPTSATTRMRKGLPNWREMA